MVLRLTTMKVAFVDVRAKAGKHTPQRAAHLYLRQLAAT